MQFVVIAKDFTDDQALSRRQNARTEHLEKAKSMKESGNLIKAAAFINDKEEMIGSVMIMDFENRELLNEWLKSEPYVLQKVWDTIDVSPVKVAPL
ncbi:YciI family protein [Jiulongibacter sp. NS-SX5]|uniref:YciI family protein n=1 Tax=Jiulongibacter sp. NS-SX5 TaxID=3463854 RepID=UPI00405967F0